MIFHLAIPSADLDRDVAFYEKIGAVAGRKYNTHAVINFFGDQLVLHRVKPGMEDQDPKMYPRHFGLVMDSYVEFTRIVDLVTTGLPSKNIFQPVSWRNKDKPEEHVMFFLRDPSNNLIEFKWYKDRRFLF